MGDRNTGPVLSDDQRLAWLRLIRSENIGSSTFRQLLNHYGSAEAALEALPALSRRGGKAQSVEIYTQAQAQREIADAQACGARFVAIGEADYPPLLRHIEAPPPLLAIRGNSDIFKRRCVAIVGARSASLASKKLAARLALELSEADVTIISGLALGIDGAAHKAACPYGTGAVFASGVDRVYPAAHADLMAEIGQNGGAAISEMPMGWEPRARDFPRRNRLISGCSLAVVVIEAAEKSGSLHTARYAADQGRDVLAVPGSPMDTRSAGCNRLIREGATLVTSTEDVLEAINQPNQPLGEIGFAVDETDFLEDESRVTSLPVEPEAGERERLMSALSQVPVGIDELVQETDLGIRSVLILLLELEIAGRLERGVGGQVALL